MSMSAHDVDNLSLTINVKHDSKRQLQFHELGQFCREYRDRIVDYFPVTRAPMLNSVTVEREFSLPCFISDSKHVSLN